MKLWVLHQASVTHQGYTYTVDTTVKFAKWYVNQKRHLFKINIEKLVNK